MQVFCILTCGAQLSRFHMERRSRNMLIIIITLCIYITHGSHGHWGGVAGSPDRLRASCQGARRAVYEATNSH